MVVWFTGTNTGKTYVEGRVYSNGGGTFVANKDGSFTNIRTGRTDVGSSQSSSAIFGEYSGVAGSRSQSGGRAAGAESNGGGSGRGVGGKPVAGPVYGDKAVVGPGTAGGSTALRVSAAMSGGSTSGFFEGSLARWNSSAGAFGGPKLADKVTQLTIGGWPVPRDPGTDDAQIIEDVVGEGDFLSPAWFMNWAAFGANMAHGVREELKANNDRGAAERKQLMDRISGLPAWNPLDVRPPYAPKGYTEQPATGADPFGFANPRYGQ